MEETRRRRIVDVYTNANVYMICKILTYATHTMAAISHRPDDLKWGNDPGDGRLIPLRSKLPDMSTLPAELQRGWVIYEEILASWLADLAARAARCERMPATLHQYRRLARQWAAWLIDQQCTEPTAADARRFLDWGARQGWGDHAIHAYRATLRSLYAWAARTRRTSDITEAIRCRPNPSPAVATGMSALLVTACIRSITGRSVQAHRDRAIIAVLYAGALEPISLHRAQRGDVDVERGLLRHQPRGRRKVEAVVRLDRQARRLLGRYLRNLPPGNGKAPLFPALQADRTTISRRPLSTLSLRLIVRRAMDQVLGSAPVERSPGGRRLQHAASRALRRSALASVASRHGLDAAMAMVQATPSKRRRFAATVQAVHYVG